MNKYICIWLTMDHKLANELVFAKLKIPTTPAVDPVTACVVLVIAFADSEAVGTAHPPFEVTLNPELQTEQTVVEQQVVQSKIEQARTVTLTNLRIGLATPETKELMQNGNDSSIVTLGVDIDSKPLEESIEIQEGTDTVDE